jgi:hypothetical protein
VIAMPPFQGTSFAAMASSCFPEQSQLVPGAELSQVQGPHFARMSVSYPIPLFHKSLGPKPVSISGLSFVFTVAHRIYSRGKTILGKHLAPWAKHLHLICQRLIWTEVEEA